MIINPSVLLLFIVTLAIVGFEVWYTGRAITLFVRRRDEVTTTILLFMAILLIDDLWSLYSQYSQFGLPLEVTEANPFFIWTRIAERALRLTALLTVMALGKNGG